MALGAAMVVASSPSEAQPDPDALLERRKALLDSDGPPQLPGLTHDDVDLNFEYTIAIAEPTDVISTEPIQDSRAFMYSARAVVEAPLSPRKWFLGLASGVASAAVPTGTDPSTGGSALLLGNPELWLRGIWSNQAGLSAGGGLGAVVPVPRTFSALEGEVVRAVRAIRPELFPTYQDMVLTGRPYIDIRHVTGPVVLQMRQGVDFQLLLRDRAPGENRYDITAFLSAYIGVRTIRQLTLGLELAEVYQLTTNTASPSCPSPCDTRRVQFTLSPSLRLRLPGLSPALSVLLPLSTPLRNEVADYVAFRLHLDLLF